MDGMACFPFWAVSWPDVAQCVRAAQVGALVWELDGLFTHSFPHSFPQSPVH